MKQSVHFDPVDLRILALVQEDATLSHAELAERAGTSAASCWRRIKALEARGVLGRTVRLVDPALIGRGVNVMCNIRMRSHAGDARQAFELFVADMPEVIECFSMSGEWDYLLRIVVADIESYNSLLMNTLLGHPSVAGGSSHFVLSTTKYTTALPI
ncbi:Lrp/AsnC family transcriptional regulator [Sphingomonas bacterium]|uniref:Lrp/AsnC family transcriptional regulator n=1 Tax=Sphingomonas bacterium TaxID=1895847 RepID=UPI001574EF1B|nr:Lrp/AsnC family transcriptional regulator [Sphingomonas bacterium]